jgi:hypothetical protein
MIAKRLLVYVVRSLALALAILLMQPFQRVNASPMTFRQEYTGGNHCCWWIVAEGEITADTPRALEQFLASNTKGGPVLFNSPGGSLIGGLRLGYIIRKHGLDTQVGWQRSTGVGIGIGEEQSICASACAYAFMGGTQRTLGDMGARLGVHRFYRGTAADNLSGGAYSERDLDDTQRIFAALVAYIREMGIDAKVVGLADRAGPNEMYWISSEEAAALGITNSLNTWSPWRIDPYQSGVLATSRRGDNAAEMTLFCSRTSGRYLVLTVKDWDQRFAQQLAGCGPHAVLGTTVKNEDVSVVPMRSGGIKLVFRLLGNVPLSDADMFGSGNYPNVCAVNFRGNKENLLQSGRLAFSNCVD